MSSTSIPSGLPLSLPLSDLPTSGGLSLDTTYGAYLLGTFVSLPMYGLSMHQLFRYVRLYPKDTTYIRILVATVMTLETVHVVLAMHVCYHYLTTNYANPLALLSPVWSITAQPVASNIVALVAEIFFARRVSLLGPTHRIIAAIAIILLLAQFGFTVVLAKKISGLQGTTAGGVTTWISPVNFGCAALADILLSGCIIRAMRRSRAHGEGKADSLLDLFMLYVVNTGLLTGIMNVIPGMILALAPSNEMRWTAFNFVTCRLAANTLLSVLNSRKMSFTRGMEVLDGKVAGRNIIARANQLAAAERWDVPQVPDISAAPIKVAVQTETETDQSAQRLSGECPRVRLDLKGALLELEDA
ncbi:hypothetical protein VTO73DRAFT_8796 [Trametes versicolor]